MWRLEESLPVTLKITERVRLYLGTGDGRSQSMAACLAQYAVLKSAEPLAEVFNK